MRNKTQFVASTIKFQLYAGNGTKVIGSDGSVRIERQRRKGRRIAQSRKETHKAGKCIITFKKDSK